MAAVALVLLCLLVGVLLRRSGRLPDEAPAALNGYVINVALPALALLHLHRAPLTVDFVTAAAGAWLMLGCAAAFFALIARRLGLAHGEVGALVLTAGLANTSFVGLPMIEAYLGRDGCRSGSSSTSLARTLLCRPSACSWRHATRARRWVRT